MITYNCDICAVELDAGGSVQHVDRYGVALDLCEKHLRQWIAFGLTFLKDRDLDPAVMHLFSRSIMDAISTEFSVCLVPDPGNSLHPESPDQPRLAPKLVKSMNGQAGIERLQKEIQRFKEGAQL